MTARATSSPHASDPFDIRPRALSIRSLKPTRGSSVPVAERVRDEFVEMRGFSPTLDQAARLFDLPRDECRRVLSGLVRDGFLRCTADGRYRLPA
jgi:hypothetical protein